MATKDDILKTLNWLKARIDNKDDGLPPGSMVPFAGTNVPKGYLLCNGAAVSRTTYAKLFAAIGTKWGVGDGSTTFNLPNSHRRFMEGTTSAGEVGQYVNAGLPNITGTYEADYLSWAYDQISKPTSGAFYAYKSSRGAACTGGASVPAGIGFRANSSHSLFGQSSTIQPMSYRTFCLIKF